MLENNNPRRAPISALIPPAAKTAIVEQILNPHEIENILKSPTKSRFEGIRFERLTPESGIGIEDELAIAIEDDADISLYERAYDPKNR